MKDIVNLISEFSGKHELLRRVIENAMLKIQERAIILEEQSNPGRKRKHMALGMRMACQMLAIDMGNSFLMGLFNRR